MSENSDPKHTERDMLPEEITRAIVIAENADADETVVRIYEGVEHGVPIQKRSMTFSGSYERSAIFLDVLMRDFGSQTEEDMQKYGTGAFLTLVHLVRGILDAYYPETVFNGSSGDPGPVFIRKIREAIEGLENRESQ